MPNTNSAIIAKAIVDDFLLSLKPTSKKLAEAIISQVGYELFTRKDAALDGQSKSFERASISGFTDLDTRITFYNHHSELICAWVSEEAERLGYLSPLDWYIRLDYPERHAAVDDSFNVTNEIMSDVFIHHNTKNPDYDLMSDALLREVLHEIYQLYNQYQSGHPTPMPNTGTRRNRRADRTGYVTTGDSIHQLVFYADEADVILCTVINEKPLKKLIDATKAYDIELMRKINSGEDFDAAKYEAEHPLSLYRKEINSDQSLTDAVKYRDGESWADELWIKSYVLS